MLYSLGTGPGDPELMTFKAVNILKKVNYLAVPVSATGQDSVALQVVRPHIKERLDAGELQIIELLFPMLKDRQAAIQHRVTAAEEVLRVLESGSDIAMITIGDPTIYSTCFYVDEIVRARGFDTQIIPAVSSVTAAAATAGVSLARQDESISIVPGLKGADEVFEYLDHAETLVIMKAGALATDLSDLLNERGMDHHAVLLSRLGFPDERVEPLGQIDANRKRPYFSTVIVKKGGL
jgi:precorrin-2/cobalt-factor-2 C20-methyltransferase